MTDVRLTARTRLVVCNGAKALFLQNTGTLASPKLEAVETLSQPSEPDRALGADRPGRAHESVGPGRSAMEETDWHVEAEKDFLKQVADVMARIVGDDGAELVLVAPPKALGYLRALLTPQVREAVVQEIASDLTNEPVPEIGKRFAW